ncbi:MAG: NifX-associated nitrogen fixation protein [Spongiibacteraceae bacterium]
MTAAAVIDAESPAMTHPFIKQMIVQLRAMDSYGTYDTWKDVDVLDPMILTKERRKEIPVVGDPDETTMSRVKAYYNAIAQSIERETGLMAVPIINITHEGFGRALILTGKLVAFDKTLRDVHRFGFDSLEDLIADAEKLIGKATALINSQRVVAEL